MSTLRAPKWDWSVHLPKMLELYNTQMSIPDIHKALQCEGFEPCQRSVYLKFKSMGYPTDPVGRTKLLDARFLSNMHAGSESSFDSWQVSELPNVHMNGHIGADIYPLPEEHMRAETMSPWEHGSAGVVSPRSGQECNSGDINPTIQLRGHQSKIKSWNHDGPSQMPIRDNLSRPNLDTGIAPAAWSNFNTSSFDAAYQPQNDAMELNGAAYFGIDTSTDETQSGFHTTTHELGNPGTESLGFDWEQELNAFRGNSFPFNPSTMEVDQIPAAFHDEALDLFQGRKSSSSSIKIPFQNLIHTSSNAGTRNRLRSLFRPKSSGSSRSKKRYPASQFTTETADSGYASGFGSCLTVDQVRQIHSQSLREFNGLYRVACHILHEPRGKAQCKDIASCTYCQYSSIHNLGWSARYLKLEVFLSELRLDGVYDFGALDAAGNTALHYAAAGGAGFKHLKALIDAGVDPYAANTAGELFIYCLRPLQPFTLEPNSDCLKGDDLVNLLELLQPERLCNWRDNNGQTVLHTLALKITEPELKEKIFRMFIDTGCFSNIPDRFGTTAEDIAPLTYDCHGQVIDSIPANCFPQIGRKIDEAKEGGHEIMHEASGVEQWRLQHIKQMKAQTTVLEAHRQPNYVDAETGDNVIHALSRLEPSNDILLNLEHFSSKDMDINLHRREGNYILLNLEYFVQKGVDLNLHNREGNHPLKSFVWNRPGEERETGATMSKYLDAVLWKDLKERARNSVSVNTKDREGATALHCAAIRGRPDSVRSLIEAGANVNARSDNGVSVLQAASDALDEAARHNENVLVHLVTEVISHLEHAGAVHDPSSLQERGVGKS